LDDKILEYYLNYDEKGRLGSRHSLEKIRTQEIISRYLSKEKLKILDVGGANGIYSFWLASMGHSVDLIDLVPKHVKQAKEAEQEKGIKLSSITLGDACKLPYDENIYDIVLLMGPLYHLQEKKQRLLALSEAKRVLKLNGIIFAAAISKFASLIDGFRSDFVEDNEFKRILVGDLKNGKHINNTNNKHYFTSAYFHYPDELKNEIEETGIVCKKVLSVEGFSCCIRDIEIKLKDEGYKKFILECIKKTEEESSIMGMSFHLLGIGKKE
jgi:2-polyprenyl-3-methyl-5-hydroxy-6-metoxy-1,4-benzoquinol methylase